MKLKFFTINALEPQADQQVLDDFCSRHRLVSVEKQLIEHDDFCFWSVCVSYLDAVPVAGKLNKAVNKRAQIDYREVLGEADFFVYAKLRDVRKDISESEGIPVYGIFSNAQLAEMVKSRIVSLKKMGEISGVGEAKLDKYGQRFLAILKAEFPTHPVSVGTANEKKKAAVS